MIATIEKAIAPYNGKVVIANKVIVTSDIPMDIDMAWNKLKTSTLLEFVAKGKVTFKPEDGQFPEMWEEGSTINTSLLLYGFIPFGGTHTLYFEKIDDINKEIRTRESDRGAKLWNHTMTMKKLTDHTTQYKDEILIFGGMMTGIISRWAKSYYIHRHQRWQLVSSEL